MKTWQKAALCVCVQSVAGWLAAQVHPAAVIAAVAVVGAAGYLLCAPKKTKAVEAAVAAEETGTEVCEQIVEEVLRETEAVCASSEPTVQLPYNVTEDRDFARWIQLFALHVKRSENINLHRLYEGLKSALEQMGIYVYDEIEFDDNGNARLPDEDYFIDMRVGADWTNVTLPIVYNSARALMHGQIE